MSKFKVGASVIVRKNAPTLAPRQAVVDSQQPERTAVRACTCRRDETSPILYSACPEVFIAVWLTSRTYTLMSICVECSTSRRMEDFALHAQERPGERLRAGDHALRHFIVRHVTANENVALAVRFDLQARDLAGDVREVFLNRRNRMLNAHGVHDRVFVSRVRSR